MSETPLLTITLFLVTIAVHFSLVGLERLGVKNRFLVGSLFFLAGGCVLLAIGLWLVPSVAALVFTIHVSPPTPAELGFILNTACFPIVYLLWVFRKRHGIKSEEGEKWRIFLDLGITMAILFQSAVAILIWASPSYLAEFISQNRFLVFASAFQGTVYAVAELLKWNHGEKKPLLD